MNNTTIGEIGANELVFNTDKEEGVFSGGFNVNSIMMKSGLSPIMTLNTHLGGGDSNKVSDLFQSLVIPNWALTYGNKVGGEYKDRNDEDSDSDSDIDDELHDKLIGLVREHENKLKQQNQNNKNKKTRKQKTSVNTKKGGTRRRK
jgi:hypothetical protein